MIPEKFSAVLVKGRGNYVSLRRLELAGKRELKLFTKNQEREALHDLEDWAYETRDGSRSSLPAPAPPAVWDQVRSDSNNCMGRKCPSYGKCFYQAARRRMENADLLICNHALFFSDLALRSRGNAFLPDYDHVIFDEAHRIEDVAAEHFGLSISEARTLHLLKLLYSDRRGRAPRGFLTTLKVKSDGEKIIEKAIHQSQAARESSRILFDNLEQWSQRHGPPNGRIRTPGVVPNSLSECFRGLEKTLRLLRAEAVEEQDKLELHSFAARALEIAEHTRILLDHQVEGCVYFLEGADQRSPKSNARSRFRNLTLKCNAIAVDQILGEALFKQKISITLTSATLTTTPSNFKHLTNGLGIEEAKTLQLGSPFDHASQMRVLVDPHLPPPGNRDSETHLIPRLDQLVRETEGGAFILFTSFALLNRMADQLRESFENAGFTVLTQGRDGPPGVLLKQFRKEDNAVLFGTSSFWQGVDVKGRSLRQVIITRLPFDVPDQPLIEARLERIRENGGNPFMEDQVPRAILKFRQGIGRLIRSSQDVGLISILDSRVVTKSYGKLFQKALPEGVSIESCSFDAVDSF